MSHMTHPSPPYRVAVIPTRDRHELLYACIQSIGEQVDRIIVIDNLSNPPIAGDPWLNSQRFSAIVSVVSAPMDPPNISALWNIGLQLADAAALQEFAPRWDIAVLNSDVTVPDGWFSTLSRAMRSTTAMLAYPDQCGGTVQMLHTEAKPIPLQQRITGYAFMLRGEAELRLDEDLKWWYGDDSLDWVARQMGGALLVPGIPVQHHAPNVSTNERPELQEQAGRDRITFQRKWGRTPW